MAFFLTATSPLQKTEGKNRTELGTVSLTNRFCGNRISDVFVSVRGQPDGKLPKQDLDDVSSIEESCCRYKLTVREKS